MTIGYVGGTTERIDADIVRVSHDGHFMIFNKYCYTGRDDLHEETVKVIHAGSVQEVTGG